MDPVVERLVVGISPDNPAGENLEDTQLLASFDGYRVFGQMAPPGVDTDWREIRDKALEGLGPEPGPAVACAPRRGCPSDPGTGRFLRRARRRFAMV